MGSRVIAALLATAVVPVILAAPAGGAAQLKPRAGYYSGQEADNATPLPVTFTVSKNRKKVVNFMGQAVVKDGCTNHIQSFQAPTSPMRINANGRFTGSLTSFPQKGVRVSVTGTFTSTVLARGHITIRFARVKGCNSSRLFSVQRSGATPPAPA